LTEGVRRQLEFTAYCDNMRQLEALAKTLKKSFRRPNKSKQQLI
jgi:hypothetical protein